MTLLNDEFKLEDKVCIILDDHQKEEIVLNFNDSFLLKYKYVLEKKVIPIDEILFLKIKDGQIIDILEYRLEEKYLFKNYFNHFKINSDF